MLLGSFLQIAGCPENLGELCGHVSMPKSQKDKQFRKASVDAPRLCRITFVAAEAVSAKTTPTARKPCQDGNRFLSRSYTKFPKEVPVRQRLAHGPVTPALSKALPFAGLERVVTPLSYLPRLEISKMRTQFWKLALASAAVGLLSGQAVWAQETPATQTSLRRTAALGDAEYCGTPEPVCEEPVGCDPCEEEVGCDPCDDCGCDDSCYLFGPDEPIELMSDDRFMKIGGWVQAGYHSGDTGQFNSIPDRFNFHQVWLYAERAADGSEGLDFGGRADIMYGIDADDTQAFGNPPGTWDFQNGWDEGGGYGWAMPQLYGEVAYGDFSVIGGHFYTLLGYEVVTAPDNFFYSHALTMYNSEAFTHTGVLGTYNASDKLTVYGGWTAGWDTGFEQLAGGSNFLGGFSYALSDDISATYITTAGDLGSRGTGYTHSIVIDVTLTEKLNYVFQNDLVSTDGSIADNATEQFAPGVLNDELSINQYLFYNYSDCLAFGVRAEWWLSDGVDNYQVTYGLNYRPIANFVLRPEVRHQNVPSLLADEDNTVFGIDGILTF